MESDTLAPMVSCVEHFWNNLGLEIPYFRFVEYKNNEIIIDFGNHYRFYYVIGYGDGLEAFATEWENARKIKG